jgi:hypothetical protein
VAVVHGVRGYVFFPEVVPPSGVGASVDGTPADVAAELTLQNATVTQLAPVLQGAIRRSNAAILLSVVDFLSDTRMTCRRHLAGLHMDVA